MYIIKRYSNRKLYDTERNKYVNLEEIAALIRQGKEISVIDNVSGDDITSITLTQILMDRERKEGNFLPQSILSVLIQAGGESLNVFHKKIGFQSELFQQVDEDIHKCLQSLIQRGEIAEEMGKNPYSKLLANSLLRRELSIISYQDIMESLERNKIPNKDDFQQLISQVDQLLEKIKSLIKEASN